MTADILLEAIEYAAREYKQEQDTYWIGAALELVALHARTLEMSKDISPEDHPAHCLLDCCVRIEKGVLVYRDGTKVQP